MGPLKLWEGAERPAWHDRAPCRGKTELFFPRPGANRHTIEAARSICRACPMNALCLEYALQLPHPWAGIYAGMTPRARLALHRKNNPK